jgi:hypothetical protein
VQIISKPVGVGAQIQNAACAHSGVMLVLELQEGSEEMGKKKFTDWCVLSMHFSLSWMRTLRRC